MAVIRKLRCLNPQHRETDFRKRNRKEQGKKTEQTEGRSTLSASKEALRDHREKWAKFPHRTQEGTGIRKTGQAAAGLDYKSVWEARISLQFSTASSPQAVSWLLVSLRFLRKAKVEFLPEEENWGSLYVQQWDLHPLPLLRPRARTFRAKSPEKMPANERYQLAPRLPQSRSPTDEPSARTQTFGSDLLFGVLLSRPSNTTMVKINNIKNSQETKVLQ